MTGTPTPLQQEMAALLYAGPGSMVTGTAALRCHHIGTAMPDLVDVLVSANRQRHDMGFVRLHRHDSDAGADLAAGPDPVR